ncbi:hypothetical protein OPV22_017819 [Ensete ventricosum]|uniref:Uncharacterized protein n=1 Tax=Ensete ventricosum TaxID=4639 RepID=A0AAV8QP50_ENSVE|nr:hypothetical protein OPV22_017819 [Ensete ventricosum]
MIGETKVEEEREGAELDSFSLLLRIWSPCLTSQRTTCRVSSDAAVPGAMGFLISPGRCRWHRQPHPMRNALLQGRSSLQGPFMETWKNLACFEVDIADTPKMLPSTKEKQYA